MPQPIEGRHYLTQGYGLTEFARTKLGASYYKNFGGIHPGLDYGTGGVNAPVLSTCAGVVVRAASDGGWGNHIEIRGRDGWNRQYAHLQSIGVHVGTTVITGEVIGRVGSTGASTATHLHYGHRRRKTLGGWEYRDPSSEITETTVEETVMPTAKLIRGKQSPKVYVFTGSKKFLVPNLATLKFLFPRDKIVDVEMDVLSKIPEGPSITNLE